MTVTLFVLDVEDFRPLAEYASKLHDVDVRRRGPYFEVRSDAPFEIDRNATGCRNAVWFSAVAAVRNGHVSAWSKGLMRIEPGASQPGAADHGPVSTSPEADLERDVT